MSFQISCMTCVVLLFLTLACGGTTDPQQEPFKNAGVERDVNEAPVKDGTWQNSSMHGFTWVVEGELAAMPLPGRTRDLSEDVDFLRGVGIRRVVSLTEEPPDIWASSAGAIDQAHIPVQDFTAPTFEQMLEFVEIVSDASARKQPVAVHCTAGLGRSGTMVAAYLASQGASAEQAIAEVRQLRPGSIETEEQESAVAEFEKQYSALRDFSS